jgi:hypothetical protein
MGVPPGCDGVVGAPSVSSGAPVNGQLDISYRCYDNHVGTAEKIGLGPWKWTYPATATQPPAGIMSDPAHGSGSPAFDTHVYVIGYDGMLYRCIPTGTSGGCAPADGHNYPYTYNFVGTPGVAYSETQPTPTRWILVADRDGQMWQFDGYNGIWTNLGQPYCGWAEGDVSAAMDSVHNVGWAAVRCKSNDAIAVYQITPGSGWTQIDTVWGYGNKALPVSKPLVTALSDAPAGSYQGNVSFETSAGEQVVISYTGPARTKTVTSLGTIAP